MRLPSVRYQQHFLTPQEADHWFIWLQNTTEVHWQQETFSIFGRRVLAPRQLAWIGDAGLNYRYTGLDHEGSGWPESLESLRARIERTAGQKFNFLLLNRYKNGQDYMGWHRDDETGCQGDIASLSLGAERRFRIEQGFAEERRHIDLEHGSLMIFNGRQRHCLTKTKRRVGERINLTFRLIQ